MRYPCGVGHIGPFVSAGTKGPEVVIILCVLLQVTNHVKHVMKSLIVGTTSLYIGRVCNCATGRPRIPYFGTCLVRNDRTCMHLACLSLV